MLHMRVRKLASWAAIILAVLVAVEPGLGRLTPAVAAAATTQTQGLPASTPQTPQVTTTPRATFS